MRVGCGADATAEQVEAMKPALVAVLGDEQYRNGYYSDFENSYDSNGPER